MRARGLSYPRCMKEAAADPRPEPPERPLPGDCCNSGCDRCVLDVYEEQMEAYRKALQRWEQRRKDQKQ